MPPQVKTKIVLDFYAKISLRQKAHFCTNKTHYAKKIRKRFSYHKQTFFDAKIFYTKIFYAKNFTLHFFNELLLDNSLQLLIENRVTLAVAQCLISSGAPQLIINTFFRNAVKGFGAQRFLAYIVFLA